MKVADLKTELRKRGAKLAGRKWELVERWVEYLLTDNWGTELLLSKIK
jgi:hypothetical protein